MWFMHSGQPPRVGDRRPDLAARTFTHSRPGQRRRSRRRLTFLTSRVTTLQECASRTISRPASSEPRPVPRSPILGMRVDHQKGVWLPLHAWHSLWKQLLGSRHSLKCSSKSPAQQGPKPRQRRQQCARSARCRAICRSDDALVAGASDLDFGSYLSVVGPRSRRRVEDGSECIGGCEAFKADARRADLCGMALYLELCCISRIAARCRSPASLPRRSSRVERIGSALSVRSGGGCRSCIIGPAFHDDGRHGGVLGHPEKAPNAGDLHDVPQSGGSAPVAALLAITVPPTSSRRFERTRGAGSTGPP
jgi:hypothetical protein